MPILSIDARRAVAGVAALMLTLVVAACSSPAAASPAVASPDASVPASGAGQLGGAPAAAPGAPAVAANPGGFTSGPVVTSSGAGVATSGTAIAYPYYGGAPAVAPEHTIVVSGYGQASMAADGADRSAAQAKALAAAMDDARAQADAIAKQAGETIIGVFSISASGGGYGYALPMAANGTTGVETPPAPATGPTTGGTGGTSGGGTAPEPAPILPTPVDFGMSVTVAYAISA